MKLFKVNYNSSNLNNNTLLVPKDQDFILAVQVDGSGNNISCETEDQECCIDSNYEYDGYKTYDLNLENSTRYYVKHGNSVFDLFIVVKDSKEIDVDYTKTEGPSTSPKIKFLDWNDAITVSYDGSDDQVYVRAGSEANCDRIEYLGFAVYTDLSGNKSGNNLSDYNLATSGFELSADTLVIRHQMPYSLWNNSGTYFNILKNRTTNVRINNGSYTSNVACFKTDEICPLCCGKNVVYVPAGTEFWLSCNSEIFNPMG